MSLVIRGRIDGDASQPVFLELDQSTRWWFLTDAKNGSQLFGVGVRRDDRIERAGDVVQFRGRSITLDEGQDERLAEMTATLDKVTAALKRGESAAKPSQARPTVPWPSTASTAAATTASSVVTTLSVASAVMVLGTVVGVLGVIGGLVVAFTSVEVCDGVGFRRCTSSRPNMGIGVGLALSVALNAAFVVMIASYIKTRMLDLSRVAVSS